MAAKKGAAPNKKAASSSVKVQNKSSSKPNAKARTNGKGKGKPNARGNPRHESQRRAPAKKNGNGKEEEDDDEKDEDDSESDAAVDYQPESDEASQVSDASDNDDEDDEDDDEDDNIGSSTRTISASNLAFLSGLDQNKSLSVPHHQAAKQAAEAKRKEKEQIKEIADRAKAEKKRAAKQAQSDSDDDVDLSGSDADDFYEEYSDVSEGEEVEQDYDSEQEEARHLSRLSKRKAREDHEEHQQKRQRANKRLPVRTLDGKMVEADEISNDEEDDDDVAQDSDEQERAGDDDDDDDDMESYSDIDREEEEEAQREQMAKASSRAVHAPLGDLSEDDEEDEDEDEEEQRRRAPAHSSILHSTRFNLTAPYEICLLGRPLLGKPKAQASARAQMVSLAKNQIASLASQIVADPEVNLGMLKRLAVFAGRTVQAPPELLTEIKEEQAEFKRKKRQGARPTQVDVDPAIRQLALLSLLAVFVDILPGYRIRDLSEQEKAERVTQDVARRREYESGLVATYKEYLQLCEGEVRDNTSKLHSSALRCMTTLVVRATHFNFRNNILQCIVARMSRRSWGADEESCYEALVTVAREDLHGEASLEIVRLIHRMTKERRFRVNSRVLDVLLELRLRDELGTKRAGMQTASDPVKEAEKEREERERRRLQHKIGKGKATPREIRKGQGQHLSKKAVKKRRELKAIEAEMKEAEATVDLEQREKNQTETLKLLFVLYFTILKAPEGSVPLHLLGSALEGLSRYAHRVNVDFFRDLMSVLREHVKAARKRIASDSTMRFEDEAQDGGDDDADGIDGDYEAGAVDTDQVHESIRHALLCLNTAFELLSGQGDVLTIDLSDLTGHLYALLLPLSMVPGIEQEADAHGQFGTLDTRKTVYGQEKRKIKHNTRKTLADLLFRSLDLVLLLPPVRSIPVERQAAFAKRLCLVGLQLPPASVLRVLRVVTKMLGREDRLLALVDSSDRAKDGVYDATADNPDASSGGVLKCGEVLWELELLSRSRNLEIAEAALRIRAMGAR